MEKKTEVRPAFVWGALIFGIIGVICSFLLEFWDVFESSRTMSDYVQIGAVCLLTFALSHMLSKKLSKRCFIAWIVIYTSFVIVWLASWRMMAAHKCEFAEWFDKTCFGIALSVAFPLVAQGDWQRSKKSGHTR